MSTRSDNGQRLKKISEELGPSVTETERLIISEIKAASEKQDVRNELLWIFTLGKVHNRWASSTRTNDCLAALKESLDKIYPRDNVLDEFSNASRFLTTYENDIIDGSDIHKGKIKTALREEFNSPEFKKIITDSTSVSVLKIFQDNKIQLIFSIIVAAAFFALGKLF